ncbi:MAG: bifunctional alpha,alpha-trehalose-phosphate synthase (UDP-forming)/trehalose-phosphatase [Acidobacteriota bacterium]
MGRLLLVSNRLPVTVRRTSGSLQVLPGGAGGLVAGLGPVHSEGAGLWFGTCKEAEHPPVARELEARRLVPVPVPAAEARRHYRGFSNGAIWPLFHYLLDRAAFSASDFESYRKVNIRFADAIAARAAPDDRIWIHDYHFLLLPALLRERLPAARIGFFLHVPFPSSEVFRLLPQRQEILRGLAGANLIGLHTYDYARHLVSSFRRLLAVEFNHDWVAEGNDNCRIGVFPMGIDVVGFRQRIASPRIPAYIERFRRRLQGRQVVLGVDRLDYTKGLPLRLEAYRRLLELEPRWRTEAVLVQVANPTRAEMASYRRLKQEVEQRVGEINGLFETEGRVPIHYLYRSLAPEALAAYYQMADVGFVTPLRDGMNLVAKEYVSCRTEDTGVLILSEFAGAASEMGEALQVNPWDIEQCARALHEALTMPVEEQARRMKGLRHRIEALDVRKWAPRFLAQLDAIHPETIPLVAVEDGIPWTQSIALAFRQARRRVVALDHDGTLTRLAATPDLAAPENRHLTFLRELTSLPDTEVILISGRTREMLESWFGLLPLNLVAEHGYEWRKRGEQTWRCLHPHADFSWMGNVRGMLQEYAARTSGAHVEIKRSALAWHYREVEPAFGDWQARELANHLSEAFPRSPIGVLHGIKVIEVRQQGLSKGMALETVLEELGPFDWTLVAGDDREDEELFKSAPPGAWTIKVGGRPSHARFRVESPVALRRLLLDLARHVKGPRRPDDPEDPPGAHEECQSP